MFGSIYIGLSGLNAHSQGLQQVSNNVTNLNTTGFKASTVSFASLYGAESQGGLNFSSGGDNAGHGVSVGEQMLNVAAGEMRQTSRDLDLAVDGKGFLVVMDGSDVRYVHTGSFELDNDGYLVLANTKFRLATLDDANRPVALSIDAKSVSAPKATTSIKFANNLSLTPTTPVNVSDLTLHDASGEAHVWKVTFTKDSGASFKVTITDNKGVTSAEKTLTFATGGGAVDPTTSKLSFTDSTGTTAELDFTSVTSFSAGDASSIRSSSIDGWGLGALSTVAVNDKGQIELSYSNNQKLQLGSVALADFRDVQSLKQESGGLFKFDGNGDHRYVASGAPGTGRVLGKRLEASNVNLSDEFGQLILIQRGFQASSQIVSVSNDMIQQLFGMRGQG